MQSTIKIASALGFARFRLHETEGTIDGWSIALVHHHRQHCSCGVFEACGWIFEQGTVSRCRGFFFFSGALDHWMFTFSPWMTR